MEDEGTAETVKSELSIFDPLPYQVSHVKADWIRQDPENNCYGTNTATPIILNFDHSPGLYLDFSDSFIDMCVAIEGLSTEAAANNKTAFVNFAMHSLFKDISFSINNTKVEGENQMYAFKAYLLAFLNSSQVAKKHQLACAGWHDMANNFDLATNTGHIARQVWTTGGRDLYLAGPLYLDTWMQDQYFTDQCDISLKFARNPPEFALQCCDPVKPTGIKINIKRLRLWVRKVQVSPSVIAGHHAGLARMNARWNYNSHKLFSYFENAGIDNISIPNICPGVYPKLILAMLVSTKAYNGDLALSPYNFRHNNITSIGLKVNGQFTPCEPYTPNFASTVEDIKREYVSLHLSTGHAGLMEDQNGILMADFAGGCTIFAFNLSPDLFLSGHGEPARLSNIGIDIKFGSPLVGNQVLLIMARYDTKIEMTQLGNVVLDPTQSAN